MESVEKAVGDSRSPRPGGGLRAPGLVVALKPFAQSTGICPRRLIIHNRGLTVGGWGTINAGLE
jgi:hypothetical protein